MTSDKENFFIPEFGVNWMVNPSLAVGVSVYGRGGMNTDYPVGQIPAQSACAQFNQQPGPYNLLCGNNAPGQVTNPRHDSSFGVGARVGYLGHAGPLSFGVAYQWKTSMDEFSDYRGLFAEGGGFDIPASFEAGVAWRVTRELTLALDWERIYFGDVKSIANPSALIGACAMLGAREACLGGSNGAGFGWTDIDVWKLGVQYAIDDRWTLRAGYNRRENPIRPEDVTFNILAPGVMEDHYTAGVTYTIDKQSEVLGFATYAPTVTVSGTSLLVGFGAPPTTSETVAMREWSVGIEYARRF